MEPQPKKLYRSRTNRMFAGVSGGLGEYFGIDPTLIRLAFVILVLLGQVVPVLLVYLVMFVVVPEEGSTSITHYSSTPQRIGAEPPGPRISEPEPKITSHGQEVATGAGGRSDFPAPEPSAREAEEWTQSEIADRPTGLAGGETILQEPEDDPTRDETASTGM